MWERSGYCRCQSGAPRSSKSCDPSRGRSLAQPGCTACDIYEEQGGQRAIVLVERFESDEALESHLRSNNYWRVLGALELSQGEPQIRFEHVSASEGMELIERHRLAAARDKEKGDRS